MTELSFSFFLLKQHDVVGTTTKMIFSGKELNLLRGQNDYVAGTSEQQLTGKINSSLSNRLVTIVNAFNVLRPKKSSDSKAKQFMV